jgi:CxxC motif-containing protein (DUF1111 family)
VFRDINETKENKMQGLVRLFGGHFERVALCALLAASDTAVLLYGQTDQTLRNGGAADPGPRGGAAGAGGAIPGLVGYEITAFASGLGAFEGVNSVTGVLTEDGGLGPRFNLDSCAGCHSQPAIGGTSPAVNPQIAVAGKAGALNTIPSFITDSGPVREARLVRNADGTPDGGVAALFTIRGRSDAAGCNITQPDFAAALANRNVVFRIPTPVFGAGLIEAIDDAAILANKDSNRSQKSRRGVSGRENRSGNDGSIMRFGWKAQNKSLFIFSGEAYNVEQGVTTDVFPHERDSTTGCRFNGTPEDHMDLNSRTVDQGLGDVAKFTIFMKFLAPPARGPINTSVDDGAVLFNSTGCSLCHTPTLQTSSNTTAAFNDKPVNLYSDLILHDMGTELADGISQGAAGGREFRTAPLWGLGQRLFFLHDGRASNLVRAIQAHSSNGSEANEVISDFNGLSTSQKQDILNFLRSL